MALWANILQWLRGAAGVPALSLPDLLQNTEPLELPGPWSRGIALAMHSDFRDEALAPTATGVLLDRLKYGGERALVRPIAKALAKALAADSVFQKADVVVHVPGARRSAAAEPTCDLARAVAKELRLPCLPRLIAKTRRLLPHKDITSWEEKRDNVQGGFRVRRPELVRGRTALLIDDVYDSGATLEEVCRTLTAAGVAEVVVATVTRTRYRRDSRVWSARPG